MSRRTRRLSWTLVAVAAASVALLLVYGPADPPQPAIAAADCRSVVGDQKLGDALLHVPPHTHAPLALVLAFHGAGGTGEGFAGASGLSKTADAHGFAVLYPNAAAHQFWSLNRKMGTEDIDRLRALLPRALAAACGDPAHVFATGVSNGGGFAARVGCELDVAAIAPVAGGYRALDRCPSNRRTSVLEIHGTADHVVPYGGKPPDRAGSVPRYLAGWARRDGCAAHPTRTRRTSVITRLRFTGCAPGLTVEHLRLTDVDHGWPNRAWGLDTNEAIWRFFSTR
jgi:polyhydroxybutyrate depolymerase